MVRDQHGTGIGSNSKRNYFITENCHMRKSSALFYQGIGCQYLIISQSCLLKIFFLPLLLCGFLLQSQAQSKIRVAGMVKDDKGGPASNASIAVKNSSVGASTDANGNFSIDVPDAKSVLVVSYLGFQTQEVTVGNNNHLNINLQLATGQLNDVVVVGYGTQRKVTVSTLR